MPLTLSVWLSDHLLVLNLFTNSVFGFRSWERTDYIFTIPKWSLGKCPLRGRNHWSSPLLLPCPILNSPAFHLFSIYTQDTTHTNTHTQFSGTFFRFGAGAPGLGWGASMGTGSPWDGFPILTSMSSAARQSPES